jgi:heme A synthase
MKLKTLMKDKSFVGLIVTCSLMIIAIILRLNLYVSFGFYLGALCFLYTVYACYLIFLRRAKNKVTQNE